MILITNFNLYVGGGEVIALDYSRHLKFKGDSYRLLCIKGSFIEKSAIEDQLEYISVDAKFSSLIFSSKNLHGELASLILKETLNNTLSFLTITFRDLYNTLLILPYFKNKIRICHYILHPEDFKYGLSLKILYRRSHLDFNNNLLNILNENSSLILPNPNARGVIENYKNQYIPFCIESISNTQHVKNREIDFEKIKIITISRFVEFKISSIIGIMLYTIFHKNIYLTVVGYGNWRFLVLIVSLFAQKRIILSGKCSKEELIQKICENDVLYAQGTTLMLGVSLGLPSLISNYSRYYDWIFGKIGSVGWYSAENKLDFGDYRIKRFKNEIHGFKKFLNQDDIKKISKATKANKSFLNVLSKESVFHDLSEILNGSPNTDSFSHFVLPKPSFIKTFLYRWKKW